MRAPSEGNSSSAARVVPEMRFDSVDDALADIRAGRLVIVVDDEDRDHRKGNFIGAAELITPDLVSFMATHGRGPICVSIIESTRGGCLPRLVDSASSERDRTGFACSDNDGVETTTGISAADRAELIRRLAEPRTRDTRLAHPVHVFPVLATNGGVLRRAGHTEAAVDLAGLAGLRPAGVLVEILNEDGTRAPYAGLQGIAERFDMRMITIRELIEYRLCKDGLIKRVVEVDMPTRYGEFRLIGYEDLLVHDCHLALVKGCWDEDEAVLVRVHSECLTGDIFDSLRCDCGDQLSRAIECVEEEGKGCVLYMKQEGRGIGLINKLKSYKLQQEGLDTVEANEALGFREDHRDYGLSCQILRDLGLHRLRLLTNNPAKCVGLASYGLEIVERVSIEVSPTPQNERYLLTKRDRMGHEILCGKQCTRP